MSDKYLIVLRGLIRGKRHWGPYFDEFVKSFPEYEIVGLDIAGNGSRFKEKSFTSIKENVLDIREKFNQEYDPSKEKHILALSLGGMIACEWVQSFPQDFKSAVLVNTSFKGISPTFKRLQLSALLKFFKIALTKDPVQREEIVYSLVSSSDPKEELIQLWAQLQRQNPISAANAIRQIYAAATFNPRVNQKFPVPGYILNGERDKLCNSACSVQTAHHWNLSIDQHPTGGHELQNDDLQWFLDHVRKWLDEQ